MPKFLLVILPALPEVVLFLGIFFLYSSSLLVRKDSSMTRIHSIVEEVVWFVLWVAVGLITLYDIKGGLNLFKLTQQFDPTLQQTTFSGMLTVDLFTKVGKVVMSAWILIVLASYWRKGGDRLGHNVLISISVTLLGGFLALSSNDLRLLLLAMGLMNVGILFFFADKKSSEHVLIFRFYKTLGIGLALLSLGSACLYAATGTTDLVALSKSCWRMGPLAAGNALVYLGLLLAFVGLCTYMLLFPFQGLSLELASISSLPLFLIIRFLLRYLPFFLLLRVFALFCETDLRPIFLILGAVNVGLGWLGSLTRNSLAQAITCYEMGDFGAYFIGLAAAGLDAVPGILLMLFVSLLASLVMLGALTHTPSHGLSIRTFDDLATAPHRPFIVRLLVGISILSCVGLPPFPGLMSFLVYAQNLLEHDAIFTLVLMVAFKMVSMGVGLNVIRALTSVNKSQAALTSSSGWSYPILSCGLAMLLMFSVAKTDSIVNFLSLTETTLRSYLE